jgi:Protein of unknown function (DUF3105)
MVFLAALAIGCGSASGPTVPVLPPLTGNEVGTPVPNEGWIHVVEGSAVNYQANPPASGPHYPVWARYEEHFTVVARPYWVHNLEHGAVVLLYRPDAPAATISALRAVFQGLPNDPACGSRRSLMTADPLLPRPVAAVAANFVFLADTVDAAAFQNFNTAHRARGPEAICDNGTRP